VPRLSILIPVLGDPQQVEDTLVSVLENRPADTQIVVALNRPYDDPYDLRGEVHFVQASYKGSLAAALNAGLEECRAPIVHVLRCGVEVAADWTDHPLRLFKNRALGAISPLIFCREDPNRLVSTGVHYGCGGTLRQVAAGKSATTLERVRHKPLGPDTLAAFYRKSALTEIGGFAPNVGDAWTGLDIAMRLTRAGWQSVVDANSQVYATELAISPPSALCRGWGAERFFWRWAPIDGWKRSLAMHGLRLTGTLAASIIRPSNLVDLCGRLAACLTIPAHRKHWRELERPDESVDSASIAGNEVATQRTQRRPAA
jgi:cellulose synthase/poly-beta-1,6-N-acetylglucosamine synthase-like glycosyltransferase